MDVFLGRLCLCKYLLPDIFPFSSMFGQVWPINVELKFLEPVGRELKLLGKVKSIFFVIYLMHAMNK